MIGRDVQARVELRLARDRIAAVAEGISEPSLRRPDGRRRSRKRLPAFNAHLDGTQPPFKTEEKIAEHTEGVVRHVEARHEHGTGVVSYRRRRTARRARLDDGRQALDGALDVGIEHRALSEVGEGRLERLQLCREFAGRGAITAVLDLEHLRIRLQLRDLGVRAPSQAQAHQHGQREQRECRNHRRLRADGETAVNARAPVGKNDRVAPRWATRGAWQWSKSIKVRSHRTAALAPPNIGNVPVAFVQVVLVSRDIGVTNGEVGVERE